jgi:hypothetical protein
MVDAVDSLLNNAVDLYVQAVDYHRIPTSQISTPVGAEIRRHPATVAGFQQYCARFQPHWAESSWSGRISDYLVGILDRSGRSGRISGQSGRISSHLAGIRPFCARFRQRSSESGTNGQILAIFAGI